MAAENQSGMSIGKLPGFVSESFDEVKKVTSPNRQQTIQATVVTVFIVCFVSGCMFVLDIIFDKIMKFIFQVG